MAVSSLSHDIFDSNVYVFSKNELNDTMKQNIFKIVSEQSKKNVNIIYKINVSLGKESLVTSSLIPIVKLCLI